MAKILCMTGWTLGTVGLTLCVVSGANVLQALPSIIAIALAFPVICDLKL